MYSESKYFVLPIYAFSCCLRRYCGSLRNFRMYRFHGLRRNRNVFDVQVSSVFIDFLCKLQLMFSDDSQTTTP
jgi:hypothetical protein